MDLDTVLANWREDAAVLRKRGHERDAALLERLADEAAAAAHEYLAWLTEAEAQLRSGKSLTWLRRRFPEWEENGHARRDSRRRLYRMLVIPARANLAAARAAGRQAGEAA